MARKTTTLRKKTYYAMNMKKAVRLLFYKRHRQPGVKGWELRSTLGSDYPKVLGLLDDYLVKLGLTVKTVSEEGEIFPEKSTMAQLDKARFYVTLRESTSSKEMKLLGWRIDDLAGLGVALGFIISKGGKAPKEDIEKLLRAKLPGWRVDLNLNRYIKAGYLIANENNQLYLGWRTRAEVDQKKLVDLFLETSEPPF